MIGSVFLVLYVLTRMALMRQKETSCDDYYWR